MNNKPKQKPKIPRDQADRGAGSRQHTPDQDVNDRPDAASIFDNDLARDNLENDIPKADLRNT